MVEPVVVVHGGAGTISNINVPLHQEGTTKAAEIGYKVLKDGGSAVEAVEAAVKSLEDNEIFNAGRGSLFNREGEIEMEASIMSGWDLKAGCVSLLKTIKNPIQLAKTVMDHSCNIFLSGSGAENFADRYGVQKTDPENLKTDFAKLTYLLRKDKFEEKGKQKKENQSKYKANMSLPENDDKNIGQPVIASENLDTTEIINEHDVETIEYQETVGAVAIDSNGHVAAATSTGGHIMKMPGRIGGTPILGSGTYADDDGGAVSTTGFGEGLMRYCLAHEIVRAMESGQTAYDATVNSINKMDARMNGLVKRGKSLGAISVSKRGEIGIYFNPSQMSWAYRRGNELHFGYLPGEDTMKVLDE